MTQLYDSRSGSAPADVAWDDLDPNVEETLDRTRRPASADEPMSLNVDADDIERIRTALRSFATDDNLPERVELAATTLDVSLQEPQAYLRRRDSALDIKFHPTDVSLIAVALATASDASLDDVLDPELLSEEDLFDRLLSTLPTARET